MISYIAPLPLSPRAAGRELVRLERFRLHLDTVAWCGRWHVAAVFDVHGIKEMLVEVVNVFQDSVLQRGTDTDVVEDREILYVLAQPDAAWAE